MPRPIATSYSTQKRVRTTDSKPATGPSSVSHQLVDVGGVTITVPTSVTNGDFVKPNNFQVSVTQYFNRVANKRVNEMYKDGLGYSSVGWVDTSNYAVQMLDANQVETQDYRWATSSDWAALNDRCLEKVFSRLKGDLNLAVDLAESAATVRMIRSTAGLMNYTGDFLTRLVVPRSIRHGLSKGQKRLDYATEKWLEAKLGWYPAVSSIYGAMEELMKEFETTDFVIKVSARRTREKNDYRVNVPIDSTPYLGIASQPMFESTQIKRRIQMRTKMHLTVRPPTPLSVYNWTSLDPAVIAWELLPLSFVADYVSNVGQTLALLESWRHFHGLFRQGFVSESSKSDIDSALQRRGHRVAPWASGTVYTSYNEVNARHQRNTFHKRSVLTSFPFPSATLRFEPKLGAQRQLTIAALFQQLVGKKLRVLEMGAKRARYRYTQ